MSFLNFSSSNGLPTIALASWTSSKLSSFGFAAFASGLVSESYSVITRLAFESLALTGGESLMRGWDIDREEAI